MVAKSAPDGYTLVGQSSTIAFAHLLEEHLLVDPVDLEERRHAEEGPEKRVALHAQLQIRVG